jgi:hypothetical protein
MLMERLQSLPVITLITIMAIGIAERQECCAQLPEA